MHRCVRHAVGIALSVIAASSAAAGPLIAQDGGDELSDRAPRFLAALSPKPVPVDVARMPVLQRRIALDLRGTTLAQALQAIGDSSGLRIAYSQIELPAGRRVRLQAKDITVAAALTEVLLGLGVDAVFNRRGQAMLVRRDRAGRPQASGAVVGRVTDAKTGLGISAAEISLEGTKWRTTGDTAGRYRLAEVDAGTYTLAVRRLGYAKQSRPVTVVEGRTDTVDLALEPVAARLDELVTTATGRQRRLELGSDITTINADSIVRNEPISSLTDLLETRVPGLSVQRTSGAPGDPARLRLRGASSPLRNNDPIVVVDGVRVYSEQSASRSGNLAGVSGVAQDSTSARAYATPSPLDYIDPNSIEKIEVIKGPSAATLYGQDAANGVIVITTKKGQSGPARWTASIDRGGSRIVGDYPELLVRWGHVDNDNQPQLCPVGDRIRIVGIGTGDLGGLCHGDSLVTFQSLNDPRLTVLDKGSQTGVTLGVSGGGSALTYVVTGSYRDEIGIIKLPDYEANAYEARLHTAPPDWMRRPQRYTQWGATSRLGVNLGPTAQVSLTTSLTRTNQQRSSLEQQLGKLMGTYVDQASGTYYQQSGLIASPGVNEITDIINGYYERATATTTAFTNVANVEWRPRAWLTLAADAGINAIQRSDQIFLPRGAAIGDDSVGYINYGHGTSLVSTVNLRANTETGLGRGFRFRFATGVNYKSNSIGDLSTQTRDLPVGTSLRGGTISSVSPRVEDDATFGWYVEPSLNNSRFFLTTGLRLDGGSTYGGGVSGLKLPKFPKLGFSYLISDESWFPFKDLVPSLRVRVAYGKASRQPGPTDRLRLFGAPGTVWGNGVPATGVFLQTLGNTQLLPEQTTEFEGGFDTDLLQNRLSLGVTGYRKTTEDALMSVPLPPSVYGSGMRAMRNIGVTRNTGIEMEIGTHWLRSGAVTLATQLLVSKRKNTVVELGAGVLPFYTSPSTEANPASEVGGGLRVAPGYPLNGRWAKPILGYADANENGVIERSEILLGDTAIYVGSTEPDYEADLSTTLSLWHGAISVSGGLQYVDGLSQRNEVARTLSVFSRGVNDPDASAAEQVGNSNLTDYSWIQTVNTVRLHRLSVSYRVPQAVARRVGASMLSIAVQGTNLGLWTNYRGLDPNVNAFGTGNNVTDTGVLPQPRTWQVRVNATY